LSVIQAQVLALTFQTAAEPVHALTAVDLDIGKDDFVSFIGPSGCGKATFLRLIAGLEHPTGGAISVNRKSPDDARRNRSHGNVFQTAGLFRWRTIAGNVRLPPVIVGYSRREMADRMARGAGSGGTDRIREDTSPAIAGQDATARLDCPRAGRRRRYPADGRTIRRAGRECARPPDRPAVGTPGADGTDVRPCHPFDPRGGLSVDKDLGRAAATGPDRGCDRQPAAARTAARHPRQPRVSGDCPSCARGARGRACP